MNGTTLRPTNRRAFTVHAVRSILVTFSQRQQLGYAAEVALGNFFVLGGRDKTLLCCSFAGAEGGVLAAYPSYLPLVSP